MSSRIVYSSNRNIKNYENEILRKKRVESGVPQTEHDFNFQKYTDSDGKPPIEFLDKKSSHCSLLKHETPDTNDGEDNFMSSGESFYLLIFIKFYRHESIF